MLELKIANPREFDEKADPALKAAVELYEESGSATIAVQIGEQETDVEKILENRPTVEIMNPANVYVDPSCGGDMDKALFVVVSFEGILCRFTPDGMAENRHAGVRTIRGLTDSSSVNSQPL